ncbi:MAG TPA: hypothetical protein VKU92_10375 [Acidimicrobiales bacterium]|nr:hypothetical protein [Acidimicrobiales bacterium]
MALQGARLMPIVCPVGDDEISGIGIFDADPETATTLMADDPELERGSSDPRHPPEDLSRRRAAWLSRTLPPPVASG